MLKTLCKSVVKSLINYNTLDVCAKRNAGHSKWQNIRHIKGAKDAERAALFAKLSRQIKVAVQEGGSIDVNNNLKLEYVVEQAKRASMPQATIQSVLKSCASDKSNCKSHQLEIKGPGGCIIILEVFTNHVHHTKQTVAGIVKKHLSKLGDGGGFHIFQEKGIILAELVKNPPKNREELSEIATDHAIESGAEEVNLIDDSSNDLEFTCGASNLKNVTKNLQELGYNILSASNEFIPYKLQTLNDDEQNLVTKLYARLEALPEVVRISDNIA